MVEAKAWQLATWLGLLCSVARDYKELALDLEWAYPKQ